MNHAARLSRNYVSLALARFGAKVISFVAWVLLARHLGAADFGIFTFSFAAVTLAVVVFQAGLTALVVREIARARARAPEFLTASLAVRAAGSLVVIGVVAGVNGLWPSPAAAATLVAAVALSAGTMLGSFTDVMQAFERMEYYAAVIVLNNVLILGSVAFALAARAGLLEVLWLYAAANGFTALVAAVVCGVKFARPAASLKWRELVAFVKSAPDFSLSALVASVYWRVDKIIVKAFAGDRAVGIYGAAAGMVEGLVFVAGSFRESIFPALARVWPASPEEFRTSSRTSFKFLVALAVPIGVGTTITAYKLFPLIYGPEYASGWVALAVLIWALVAIFVRELSAATLFALDRQRAVLVSNALGAAVSVGVNFALVPVWGGVGAAAAGVVTALGTTALNLALISRRVPNLYPWRLLLKPALAAAAMAGALALGWRLPVWLDIILGAAVYGGVLAATRYYRWQQLAQLWRAR